MSDTPTKPEEQQAPAAPAEEARPDDAAAAPVEPPRLENAAMPEPDTQKQEEAAPAAAPQWGALNSLFNGLSAIGPIALLAILAAMAWPMFWQQHADFFCPAELKSITAFLHCIAQNSWLAPTALDNGAFTAAQWPAFSWWTGIFAFIPGLTDSGFLLPAATFAATFLAVFAVWGLGIAARFGAKAAFAGSVILLCAPVFAPLPHFMGPAALAAAFLLLALMFFSRGWLHEYAFISLPLAFIFTALAGLCGGPFHFVVPILASILFLIWKGAFRRAQHADAIIGFMLMLVIIGFWLGAISLSSGHDNYLNSLFGGAFHFALPTHIIALCAIIIGILGLLPWLLLLLGVSWGRVLAQAPKTLGTSRRDNASALVWLALVISLCIAPFTAAFHPAAIAIAALAAALLGKAFINLRPAGNRFFFALASIFMILAGAIICLASFKDTQALILDNLPQIPRLADVAPHLTALEALPILGGICILSGLLGLLFARRCKANGGLILAIATVIALCQPARLMLVPEIAAMPGTPLASYAAVEKQALDAMTPKTPMTQPETPAIAAPAQTAPAQPDAQAKPEETAAQPETASPDQTLPETAAPEETQAKAPDKAVAQKPADTGAEAEDTAGADGIKQEAPKEEAVEEVIVVEEKARQAPENAEEKTPAAADQAQ